MSFKIGDEVYVPEKGYIVKILGRKKPYYLPEELIWLYEYETSDGKSYQERNLVHLKMSKFFTVKRVLFHLFLLLSLFVCFSEEYNQSVLRGNFGWKIFSIKYTSIFSGLEWNGQVGFFSIGWVIFYSFCFYNRNGLFNLSYLNKFNNWGAFEKERVNWEMFIGQQIILKIIHLLFYLLLFCQWI